MTGKAEAMLYKTKMGIAQYTADISDPTSIHSPKEATAHSALRRGQFRKL